MMSQANNSISHNFGDEPFCDCARVRISFANLDKQTIEATQLSWLSTTEHIRATRLKSQLERQRYIAAHVFTRRLLSDVTGVAPERLEIEVDKCGKPCLTLPATHPQRLAQSSLGFNVSHSENVVCIATAWNFDVGVDIEAVNPELDVLTISRSCLDQEEIDQVLSSPPDERRLVFYRLWTRKEAFGKMQGHGIASNHADLHATLSWPVRTLEFTLGDNQIVGSVAISARQQRQH